MSDTAKFLLKTIGILLLVLLVVYLIADIFNVLDDKFGFNIGQGKSDVVVEPLENSVPILRNGDLTREEIEKQKKDVEAPTCDDIFKEYFLYETDNYVFVSRKVVKDSKILYPTLLFSRTQKGTLEYNGTVGLTANISVGWMTGIPDFKTLKFNYDYSHGFNFKSGLDFDWATFVFTGIFSQWNAFHDSKNIVAYNNFNFDFCPDILNFNGIARSIRKVSGAEENDKRNLQNLTQKWINENILPYFFDLEDGVELIRADKSLSEMALRTSQIAYVNSYVTYLWNQSKMPDKSSNQKIVDISEYFARFIYDEDIYKQFPIPTSKKAEYGNKEYYTVYNCKILANVVYTYEKVTIDGKPITGDGNYDIIPPPTTSINYNQVTIKLVDTGNSDLTNLDLSKNPVNINFDMRVGASGGSTGDGILNSPTKHVFYDISFNNINDLKTGKSLAMESGICNYMITSNELIFESLSGTFTVNEQFSTLTLNYQYVNGYVNVSVSLHNISAVDTSSIDLAKNPVKIVYNSKTGGAPQQFVFNKNEDLTKTKSALMKIGEYEYSVLSEQLVFSSTSGNQTISTTNREFVFTYSVEVYQDDLKFIVTVSEAALSGSNDLKIFAEESTTSLLGSKIGQTGYSVKVKIFDKDGYIVKTCDHKHGGNICTDKWSSNGTLIVGETYTGQLLYLNTNDNSKSYVTGTFTFEYKANTEFTFTYSCVEV